MVSSSSSPRESSSSSELGSQAGGSPLVRKHRSFRREQQHIHTDKGPLLTVGECIVFVAGGRNPTDG